MCQRAFIDGAEDVNFGVKCAADSTIHRSSWEAFARVAPEDSPVINLTGWVWQCQFFDLNGVAKTPFTVTPVSPAMGRIDLRLTRSQTADAAALPERMTWRLFGEDAAAYKRKHLFGSIIMQS